MRILLILLAFLVVSPAFAATSYFSALPELPLPPQMMEDQGSAVRFDQPEGRVIVLQASGTAQPSGINDFYLKTLPALGWKNEGNGRFTRTKEALILDVKPLDKTHNRLNILLKPQ
jgi:hypothetical protein